MNILPPIAQQVATDLQRLPSPAVPHLVALLHQRTAQGIATYGRPLQVGDSQPWGQHSIEELLDLLSYLQGWLKEGSLQGYDRARLQRLYSALLEGAIAIEEIRGRVEAIEPR